MLYRSVTIIDDDASDAAARPGPSPLDLGGEAVRFDAAPVAGTNENVFQYRAMTQPEALVAPNILEYTYTRTVGPVLGRFFTGLRDGVITGIRLGDGRVAVPPVEYDPATGASLAADDMVEVADTGVVTTWTWVAVPRQQHLLDRPFAFALITLDGADTALLHYVDAGAPSAMSTGMRVKARWKDDREGVITDIACFGPEAEGPQ